VIRENDEEIWNSFIREHRSPSIHAISDPESLQKCNRKQFESRHFFLIFRLHHAISKSFQISERFLARRESSDVHLYIRNTTNHPQSHPNCISLSPNCSRVFSGTNVNLFVSQNKCFCFTYKYDLEEYQNMIDESEAFVFLVVKQLENSHKEMTFAHP
jgi:hypothetical protein